MLNILILENNPIICKNLINKIQPNLINAKINNLAFSENDVITLLKENRIDIIILDINCCSYSFLNLILNTYNIQNSIIAYSLDKEKNHFHKEYSNIFYKSLFDKFSITKIYSYLLELINLKSNTTNTILQSATLELEKLAFNLSHHGTKYLCECISLIYPFQSDNIDFQNKIYPIIAQKYHTNITNIKCSIYQANKISYSYCDKQILSNYFGRKIVKKPTTKEIIDAIISHI